MAGRGGGHRGGHLSAAHKAAISAGLKRRARLNPSRAIVRRGRAARAKTVAGFGTGASAVKRQSTLARGLARQRGGRASTPQEKAARAAGKAMTIRDLKSSGRYAGPGKTQRSLNPIVGNRGTTRKARTTNVARGSTGAYASTISRRVVSRNVKPRRNNAVNRSNGLTGA